MSDPVSIQWFPGHMAKTGRMIAQSLSLVDCVAEVLDARVPESSRNPELDSLCAAKPRILLLNKTDLADDRITSLWIAHYEKGGLKALAVDCKSGKGLGRFIPLMKDLLRGKLEKYAEKGMAGRTLRVMIAGIPNSGKSTFINRMAGSRRAKAENRPGVTRGKQWITLSQGVEMLDTPGILWPKFEDPQVGERLAFIGSVKDDILDSELLAARLLETLRPEYLQALGQRFKITSEDPSEGTELLRIVAKKRGLLISGGEPDLERASALVLEEFRSGKLGRITLEKPSEGGEAL